MNSFDEAIERERKRGVYVGARVDTDNGLGTVTAVTDRTITVRLDNPGTWTSDSGKVIANDAIVNIQRGTHGYDRIVPKHRFHR